MIEPIIDISQLEQKWDREVAPTQKREYVRSNVSKLLEMKYDEIHNSHETVLSKICLMAKVKDDYDKKTEAFRAIVNQGNSLEAVATEADVNKTVRLHNAGIEVRRA